MTKFIYRLLIILVSPLVWVHIAWKTLKHRDLRYGMQRIGLDYRNLPRNCIWLHCASVGEVNAALPLVHALHERRPELCFLVTTNTPTGASIVSRQGLPFLVHAYLPFDWAPAVSRLVRHIRPLALFVVETELWPNLFFECRRLGVPVNIINGRLSPRTTQTSGFVRRVLKRTLQQARGIYTRTQSDADAYIALGAEPGRVSVVGNIKYARPAGRQYAPAVEGHHLEREVVVVASTHDDEEVRIAQRWAALARPELLLIAPRHPERSDAVLRQLMQVTPAIAVRSHGDVVDEGTAIYLLDTVGELNRWFDRSKLVIMGGTFVPVGGHNILEPAHAGKAVLFGPHMRNFADEARDALAAGAALQVEDMDALFARLVELLDDEAQRRVLETNALRFSQSFQDVVERYADIVEAQLDAP